MKGFKKFSGKNLYKYNFRKLIKNYNLEFNPVCSIVAGIVSQEVLKVLTGEGAFTGLYTYDSEQESGNFLDLLNL